MLLATSMWGNSEKSGAGVPPGKSGHLLVVQSGFGTCAVVCIRQAENAYEVPTRYLHQAPTYPVFHSNTTNHRYRVKNFSKNMNGSAVNVSLNQSSQLGATVQIPSSIRQ